MKKSDPFHRACLCLASVITSLQVAHAQPVQVRASEEGQGYLFRERGICYVITAAHVTDGARRAQIFTEGGKSASATMLRPFWSGFDLDIGQVRQIADEDCREDFSDLLEGASLSLSGQRLTLPLIGLTGVENETLEVKASDYLEFQAAFIDPELAGRKGMSGSFALLNGVPAGMARVTTANGDVRFIQMAEITMNLRRYLDREVSTTLAVVAAEPADQAQSGLPFEIVSSTPAAIDSTHMIEAMIEGSAPFAYQAGNDAVIILRNLAEGRKVITRLRIESDHVEGYTQPVRYKVELVQNEANGTAKFWKGGTFPPDGLYDTGVLGEQFAAQIKITLIGARGEAPVRIDRIVLD